MITKAKHCNYLSNQSINKQLTLPQTISNSIRDDLRPVSSLLGFIRQAQSQDIAVESLSPYALKLPFVGKVRKVDTAKSFTAQRLRHCEVIVCAELIKSFRCYKCTPTNQNKVDQEINQMIWLAFIRYWERLNKGNI